MFDDDGIGIEQRIRYPTICQNSTAVPIFRTTLDYDAKSKNK